MIKLSSSAIVNICEGRLELVITAVPKILYETDELLRAADSNLYVYSLKEFFKAAFPPSKSKIPH